VIFNDETVAGRERVTTDEDRVLRVVSRDQVVKIGGLCASKYFVGEKKELRFHTFSCLRPHLLGNFREYRLNGVGENALKRRTKIQNSL